MCEGDATARTLTFCLFLRTRPLASAAVASCFDLLQGWLWYQPTTARLFLQCFLDCRGDAVRREPRICALSVLDYRVL
jgi:hypothetical protein